MTELGALKRLDPRKIWKDEARDFSPWLRDNISQLSEAIGLDIDLVESEVDVGSFSADLVGADATTKRPVVIENQLARTDHDHLGKAITYASGKDAGTLVWIATKFRDEHRQALDWLNEVTGKEIYFFDIEIELLQVDESRPAAHFKVVASPNEWRKASTGRRVTPRMQAYHTFFSELLEALKSRHPGITSASKVGYDGWLGLSAGRSGFGLSLAFSQGQRFRVELYIDTGDGEKNRRAFDALSQNKTEIEEALGTKLAWERLETARASRVALYWPETVTVMDAEDRLSALREWAIETVAKFKQVLRPHIVGLDL